MSIAPPTPPTAAPGRPFGRVLTAMVTPFTAEGLLHPTACLTAELGGQQEVAAAHPHRITVDDRPDHLALDDEAKCVLCVPVLRREGLCAFSPALWF